MVGLDSRAENHIFLLNRGTSICLKTAILFQCVCFNTVIYRYVWGFFKKMLFLYLFEFYLSDLVFPLIMEKNRWIFLYFCVRKELQTASMSCHVRQKKHRMLPNASHISYTF